MALRVGRAGDDRNEVVAPGKCLRLAKWFGFVDGTKMG